MRWVLSTFDFTLENAVQESNLRDPVAFADRAGFEIMSGRRLPRQEPHKRKECALIDLLFGCLIGPRLSVLVCVRLFVRFPVSRHEDILIVLQFYKRRSFLRLGQGASRRRYSLGGKRTARKDDCAGRYCHSIC
jgi:hypothetical protein